MKRFFLTVVCACAFALMASAQEERKPSARTHAAASSYMPDLAELMTITQLRHLKLVYAAEASNWALANYEAGLVRKSLHAAAEFYPVFQNVPQGELIADVSDPALKEIDRSISARDRPALEKSLKDLTDACNSCHQQARIAFIVIRIPTSSPFSNQVFPPQRK